MVPNISEHAHVVTVQRRRYFTVLTFLEEGIRKVKTVKYLLRCTVRVFINNESLELRITLNVNRAPQRRHSNLLLILWIKSGTCSTEAPADHETVKNPLKGLNFFTCKLIPKSSKHLVPPVVSYCTTGDLSLTPAMELSQLVSQLNKFASPSLAESWDNVGLLVEPSAPHEVKTLLLTNDLTPSVLDEAIRCDANMILSYHPPIFSPLKRLNQKNWKERLIVKCIENRIAVYSPHTSYDAVQDGVNDWLIQAFDLEDISPIVSTETMPDKYNRKLLFTAEQFLVEPLQSVLSSVDDIMVSYVNINESTSQISVLCWADAIPVIMSCIQALSDKILSTEVYDLQKIPKTGHGMGRKGTLVEPISLEEAVQRVKTHLGLEHVRLAKKNGNKKIKTVAVCAGSGGQLLRNVPVSLYVTGEMSHHDVLHAQQSGSNVILCDHSNTERGFLKVLKEKFDDLFDRNLNIIVSKTDRDPLEVV